MTCCPASLPFQGFVGSTVMKWASGSVARLPVFSLTCIHNNAAGTRVLNGPLYGDNRDNVAEDLEAFAKMESIPQATGLRQLAARPFPVSLSCNLHTAGLQACQLLALAGPLACPSLAPLSPARKGVL